MSEPSSIRQDIEQQKVSSSEEVYTPEERAYVDKALEIWQGYKFGVIVHWGLYSQAGIVESWELSPADDWAREPNPFRPNIADLQRDYWGLESEFNPSEFDPLMTAKMFRDAGFKYCILTSKHHDGFNMYNTSETDYKLGGKNSPFKLSEKGDLYKQTFDALRAEGISPGIYYSKADWHSPYYWEVEKRLEATRRATYNTKENPELWQKYVHFVHNQIRELTNNYGQACCLWLDAGWCGGQEEDLNMNELARIARAAQDHLLIVDRTMGGKFEDYVTPEREIPSADRLPQKPWETCIPLANNWGYAPNNEYKSAKEVISKCKEIFELGGNFVLGVGPDGKGRWAPQVTDALAEIGEWVRSEGKAYGL